MPALLSEAQRIVMMTSAYDVMRSVLMVSLVASSADRSEVVTYSRRIVMIGLPDRCLGYHFGHITRYCPQ